jgi:phenylacetate-CoA ligase
MTKQTAVYENVPLPRDAWLWDRSVIVAWQLARLNQQFAEILPANRFYRQKFRAESLHLSSLQDLQQLPMTTKDELVRSVDEFGLSQHQTYELSRYTRMHRTSGTTGTPLLICDTAEDWQGWWSVTWQHVLEAADVTQADRVFLAFSFGPFIGFWSAHQACQDRGVMVIPGGGLSSIARLEFIRQSQATVVLCTPSYALHLAEVAQRESLPLSELQVDRIIVAGEAGGSLPAVRSRIESAWQAKVVDHCGATEVGPWGFGWPDRPGIHVIETSFIAELLPIGATQAILPSQASPEQLGESSELVLTSLGRLSAPVFRYRTGDIVQASFTERGDCNFLWLAGGITGRADDMVTIRGVNLFPSSIEAIVREFASIQEYRVIASRNGELDEIRLEVEAPEGDLTNIRKRLDLALGLRIAVSSVPPNSLPRSEGKAKRWIDQRCEG